jgi:hypothetical protein
LRTGRPRPAPQLAAAASLAVLAAGACAPVAVPAAPASPGETRTAPEDEDLLAAVPAEAEVVLLVDLAQLRRSPWTRELLAAGAAARAPGPDRGFDEAKDVDRLVLARLPRGSDEQSSVTLAQGRFDRKRVFAAFRQGRTAVTGGDFRGCALLSSGPEAIAFLTDRTVLSGEVPSVRASIDAALGRARDVRGERWWREARQPSRSSSPPAVELAVQVTDPMRQGIHDELEEAEALERLGGRVDLGPRLDLTLTGVTASAPRARALAARLEQALAALQERPSVRALGLGEVLAGVRIDARGPAIGAELHLTEAQRDDIAARLSAAARLIARARSEAAGARPAGGKGSP